MYVFNLKKKNEEGQIQGRSLGKEVEIILI